MTYKIKNPCQSYILIQLSKKRGVRIYISDEHEEPGSEGKSHRYVFGDLTED